jgi:hypothetical protein
MRRAADGSHARQSSRKARALRGRLDRVTQRAAVAHVAQWK